MKFYKWMIIILAVLIFLVSINYVSAANVCCEKTKTGEYCQNTDSSNCETGLKDSNDIRKGYYGVAATSCALTSFCSPGCCFNPTDDGLCYANYPKANCESRKGIFDSSDASCDSSAQCQEGCCIIGSEASIMTEAKCRKETTNFPNLEMEFRSDVKDEISCVNIARQAEKGCCVKSPDSCSYGARSLCDASQTTSTGFFSDKYCSELTGVSGNPLCNCVSAGKTGCISDSDDVYYFDSCGNPEKVKETCDYMEGKMCGDSDKDGIYTCESLNCQESGDNNLLSLNLENYAGSDINKVKANDVLNGESWCLYDSKEQNINIGGRNPPGSRFYRSICINGKEVVEPCEDYRKEWCVDGDINVGKKADGGQAVFHEARCRENRWESCVDSCNTINNAENEGQALEALNKDFECCVNTDLRDCAWIGPSPSISGGELMKQSFGSKKFPQYCRAQTDPGFKFWESEGSDACSKADMECEIKFRCPGVSVLTAKIGLGGDKCGWRPISGKGTGTGERWEVLYGDECLSKEFIQSANDLCRSMGDCGADVNLEGKISYGGFSNTPKISNDFSSIVDSNKPGFLRDYGLGNVRLIAGGNVYDDKGKFKRFFEAGGIGWSLGFNTAFALAGGIAGAGAFKGINIPFSDKIIGDKFFPNLQTYAQKFTGISGTGFLKGAKSTILPLKLKSLFGKGGAEGVTSAAQKAFDEASKNLLDSIKNINPDANLNEVISTARSEPDILKSLLNNEGLNGDELVDKFTETQSNLNVAKSGSALKLLNGIMWAWTSYQLVNTLLAEEETAVVKTTCSPWVAPVPTKGACEGCNPDEYQDVNPDGEITNYADFKGKLKCSQYKCKSYGAACDIINEGTEEEKCVSKEPSDVKAPLLSFWKEGSDKNFAGIAVDRPRIGTDLTAYEIPAYDRVLIGIQTDEPSQCKMSFKKGIAFEKMEPIYFGTSTYKYFHSAILTYPRDVNSTSGELKLGEPGNVYELNVRCQDALGNDNEKDYVIKFRVKKGPDITSPVIEGTSIGVLPAERYLSLGANSTDITLYLSESATCKWSNSDVDYDSMKEDNECKALTQNFNDGLYTCEFSEARQSSNIIGAPLSGFTDTEFKYYYFKCKDQPSCINGKLQDGSSCTRNTNKQSYVLTLRKSRALNLTEIKPSGTVYIGSIIGNITLEAKTEGGAERNGRAYCGFTISTDNKENIWAMSAFARTNSSYHSQILSQLSEGRQTYYVGCIDVAGNSVYGMTAYDLKLDVEGPIVARAYKDTSSGTEVFKIVTNEEAVCEYNTDSIFSFGNGNAMLSDDGKTHSAQGGSNTYYVACEDNYKNKGSLVTINFLT